MEKDFRCEPISWRWVYLPAHDILVTGLNYPVVPWGDEEIRFQISASHTEADIDQVLNVLRDFQDTLWRNRIVKGGRDGKQSGY